MATPRAEGAGTGATGGLKAAVDDFRGRSRYDKLRVAVIAAWVVLSAASVAFALTGGQGNDLGAAITVVDTGFGTALDIQNHGKALWQNVTVTLEPGRYVYRQANLRPGDRISLEVKQFERPGPHGLPQRPKAEFMPRRITVRTSSAAYTQVVHPAH